MYQLMISKKYRLDDNCDNSFQVNGKRSHLKLNLQKVSNNPPMTEIEQ